MPAEKSGFVPAENKGFTDRIVGQGFTGLALVVAVLPGDKPRGRSAACPLDGVGASLGDAGKASRRRMTGTARQDVRFIWGLLSFNGLPARNEGSRSDEEGEQLPL